MNRQISRRTLLRGAGASLALPWLHAMAPNALSATPGVRSGNPAPLRMGIVTVTGGTVLESWKPEKDGPLDKLPSILRSLEPHKSDIMVLSGLSHGGRSTGGLNGHEQCAFLHLTGAREVKKENGKVTAAVSIDQAVAQGIGHQTYLPSVEMGQGNHETRYSFRNADQMVLNESNPQLVFNRMFRGREAWIPNFNRRPTASAGPGITKPKLANDDRSVLDLVQSEAKSLQKNLGTDDKRKMDEYLQSVRSIEKRIAFLEQQALQRLADQASGKNKPLKKAELPKRFLDGKFDYYALHNEIHHDPEPHGQYIEIMSDLMVLAYQTDTTRVITYSVGSDGAQFPGVVTVGYEYHAHTLEHNGNARRVEDADPIAREGCRQIHAWYTQMFGKMLEKMKHIDEGGESLLDHCMLLYTSYMSNGGHGRHDYPVLLAGKAKGTLKPGRHIAYRKDTPVSNLYLEMGRRMGLDITEFGESKTSTNATYGGRLPGLV